MDKIEKLTESKDAFFDGTKWKHENTRWTQKLMRGLSVRIWLFSSQAQSVADLQAYKLGLVLLMILITCMTELNLRPAFLVVFDFTASLTSKRSSELLTCWSTIFWNWKYFRSDYFWKIPFTNHVLSTRVFNMTDRTMNQILCWTHLRFALLAIWGRTCSILQCTARASITTHTTVVGRRHISTRVSTRYLTRDRNHPTLPDLDWMMIVMMTITSLRKIMIWEKTTEGAEAKTTLAMTKRTRNMVKSVYYPKTIWLNTRWYWQFHFLQKEECVG